MLHIEAGERALQDETIDGIPLGIAADVIAARAADLLARSARLRQYAEVVSARIKVKRAALEDVV